MKQKSKAKKNNNNNKKTEVIIILPNNPLINFQRVTTTAFQGPIK